MEPFDPVARLPVELYLDAREWLLAHDPDGRRLYDWAATELRPPATPEALAGEVVWIILCAGRSAQSARTIERKVWNAIDAGRPVVDAFGYKAKAAAIERAWNERAKDFAELQDVLKLNDPEALVEWCGGLPFVGEITRYQLVKNLGISTVPKPDIWLSRLSGIADRPAKPPHRRFRRCLALCEHLSAASGDGVAVVDTMLWLACNKQVLRVSPEAGPITLALQHSNRAPIAPEAPGQLELF